MSYEVKQGNIFGRLGEQIGKGLADQLPKEVENYRLRTGLEKLGKEAPNLTPLQFATKAYGTYGITPQMVQSLGELARQQGIRNAYSNYGSKKRDKDSFQSPLEQVNFANLKDQSNKKQKEIESYKEKPIPSDYNQSVIQPRNPLSPELMPKRTWTPERRNEERGMISREFPFLNPVQIDEMALDNERRELAAPEAELAIENRLEDVRNKANEALVSQLKTKTHKLSDEELYKAVPGEIVNSLKRGMASELVEKPDSNIDKLSHKWSELGLENAKAEKDIDVLLSKNIFQNAPSTMLQKLKSSQKSYANTGNQEGLYNKLVQEGFSPQRSAQVSYPVSGKINSFINSHKRLPSIPKQFIEGSRKAAKMVERLITPNDSILSIARSFKDKDPYFDERSFFDQLREDQSEIGLTQRQSRELGKGESDLLPNWKDLWIFPWPHGIK